MSHSRSESDRLSFYLLKEVNRAIREFEMVRPGDRIAVAVSGGMDSLALLHLLALRRASVAEEYSLAAIHVCGDASGITGLHPPLAEWMAAQGVPFRAVEPEITPAESLPLTCQRCTWLRRKALFMAAQEMGCNVLAFAHHADDAAQTTLLNLLYGGNARTLQPTALYFGEKFRLIRPLFYVPKSDLARLGRAMAFPPPPPACSRASHSRRRRAEEMLRLLGRDYLLQARTNLIRAGLLKRE